ncbi:hypothetical protein I3843_09G173300 [Carya illinoinensis]|nr:hypothetical protein I3843_09G173300 [Carya illinoinensis]
MSFGAFFQSCTFSSWVIFFTLLAFLSSFFHCYLTLLAFLSSFFSLFPAVLNVFCSFLMVISFQVFLVGDFQSFTFLIFIFEHLSYIKNLVAQVSQKEWKIELLVDFDRLNQKQYKNFNVVSIDAVQDDTK